MVVQYSNIGYLSNIFRYTTQKLLRLYLAAKRQQRIKQPMPAQTYHFQPNLIWCDGTLNREKYTFFVIKPLEHQKNFKTSRVFFIKLTW
jgi:hypothetical protein